ncbi:ArnT family glycosyltransferase, partial [Thermococcus sp.]
MRKAIYLLIIVTLALLTRFPLLLLMNAYFDYDEGTYLLIARLINHGILPYRDIFAVHPPLYYYALAGWLRIFGDNYVSGRTFSLFLGLISIFLAYLTGRELKGEKLGLAFALLIALDPLAIRMNTLVLHESMIEFFTLLSLWFLVRYLKSKRKKHAYLAVVVASLGTSAKFTIIPYLLAVFVFLLLYESTELRSLLLSSAKTLTRKQEYIVPLTYLLWTMIAMAAVTLYPKEVTRIIASVPGINPITKVGHVYTCILFIFLWAFLTVYLLGLRYFQALNRALKALPGVIRHGAVLVSVVILSKAVVEIPLGLFVSSNYISQTYLAQSNRGYPFVGIFWVMGKLIAYTQKSSLELLSSYAPLFILIGIGIAARASGHRIKFSCELKALLLLNVVFYLIAIPMIPDPRFIYPLLLVFYIYLLTGIVEIKKPGRKVLGIALTMVILLALVDIGIGYNYPRGLLRIPCAPHTKELRGDLSSYIHKENLSGTYLSINPMDAYYLRLPVVPYLVDTFGLGYLRGYSLVNLTLKYHPDYIIYDTWMFSMMQSKPLRKVYGPLLNYTLQNSTLLFEESRENGEIIALFTLERPSFSWRFDVYNTTLNLYYGGDRLNVRFKGTTMVDGLRIEALKDTYKLVLFTNDGTYTGSIVPSKNSVTLYVPNFTMVVTFNGVLINNSSPVENG